MGYELYDFTESLACAGRDQAITPPQREEIKSVLWAWGIFGDCAEWEGAFGLELNDGRFCTVSGWCDTTGWGCQDGGEIEFFDAKPSVKEPEYKTLDPAAVDINPADLNRWINGEIDAE